MRKSIYLITSLFSMLLFLFLFDTYDFVNELNANGLRLYEKAPDLYYFGNYFDIQDVNEKDDVVQKLIQFADDNDVELESRITYTDEYMREVGDKYIYSKNPALLKDVNFDKGKGSIDFTSDKNLFYSNSQTDQDAYNYISFINRFYRENDGKSILRYYPYSQITKAKDISLGVSFYSYKPEEVLQKLMDSSLGKYINEDFIRIRSAQDENRIEADYSNQYRMITILAGISMIATIFQTIYKKRRLIGIYKQFGIPTYTICKKLFFKTLVLNSILYLFVQSIMFYIFCGIFIPESIALIKALLLCYLGVICLFAITYGIAYCFIKNISIVTALKVRKNKKEVFYTISYAVKFCMIILVASSFLEIFSQVNTDGKILLNYTFRKNEMSQYYQMYEYSITTDKERDNLIKLYEIGNRHGALLAQFQVPQNSMPPTMTPIDTDNVYLKTSVIANDNYLSLYSFIDELGNEINLNQYDEDVCLIPIESKDKMHLFYGEPLPETQIYYKNKVRLYSYNYPTFLMYEDNPIVLRPKEFSSLKMNPSTYVIPKTAYSDIKNEMKEQGLENAVSYTSLERILDTNMNDIAIDLLRNLLILVIYMFSIFCIVRQSLASYLQEYGQKIAMRYLHGWNFFKRCRELYLTNIVCYTFVLILLIGIMKIEIHSALYYTVVCVVYDYVIMILSIKYSQKKMITQCLKGDEWK